MKAADIRAFANRDWRRIRALKDRYWIERKRSLTPAEALDVGDDLRQWALTVRPDWPSDEERREDLAHHTHLANLLLRVPRAPES